MMPETSPHGWPARYAPPLFRRTWEMARREGRRLVAAWKKPCPLFAFSGVSETWAGEGGELYVQEVAFRTAVHDCAALLSAGMAGALHESFRSGLLPSGPLRVLGTAILQLALVELWRAYGVQPAAVLGWGLGEVAAVYAAGGLDLAGALRAASLWEEASGPASGLWRLLAVDLGAERAGEWALACPATVFLVAAVEASRCVLLCPEEEASAVCAYLGEEKIAVRKLAALWLAPYHTPLLDPKCRGWREDLRSLPLQPLARPCYLAALGRVAKPGTVLGTDYWVTALGHAMQLHAVQQAAVRDGYRQLVPVGSDPFLEGKENSAHPFHLSPLRPGDSGGMAFRLLRKVLAGRTDVLASPPPGSP